MKLTDLTGEEYDEVETIIGKELDLGGVSPTRVTRAIGFVLAKRGTPGLTWPEFNKLPISEQIKDVDFSDNEGKAPTP